MTADRVTPADESDGSVRLMLARRLRRARIDALMSQSQLAVLLHVTQPGLSLYESGDRGIGVDLLWQYARLLNRPLSYFLGDAIGGLLFPRDSEIAQLIEGLEQHREDLAELTAYWHFLQDRRAGR
jgi:transcriptional regulator with XRE-family HTH domain